MQLDGRRFPKLGSSETGGPEESRVGHWSHSLGALTSESDLAEDDEDFDFEETLREIRSARNSSRIAEYTSDGVPVIMPTGL